MQDDNLTQGLEDLQNQNEDQSGAGKKGGESTKQKYGNEFYQEIGQEGGEKSNQDQQDQE